MGLTIYNPNRLGAKNIAGCSTDFVLDCMVTFTMHSHYVALNKILTSLLLSLSDDDKKLCYEKVLNN